MPIVPPRSNVQLLNPAALLSGRSQEEEDDFNFDQLINFALQQKLQESSQAFSREENVLDRTAARERADTLNLFTAGQNVINATNQENLTISQLLASGDIFREDNPNIRSIPGIDALETFTIGNNPGQFLSGVHVAALQVQHFKNQPVTSIGGRQLFPGTTQADIDGEASIGIAGTSVGTPGVLDDFTEGDRARTIGMLAGLRENSNPEIRAEIDAIIAGIERDQQFSLPEEKAITDRFDIPNITATADSHRAVKEQERELQATFGQSRVNFGAKMQVMEPGGDRPRDLTPSETFLLAMNENGMQLTEDQEQYFNEVLGSGAALRPRLDAHDVGERVITIRANAGIKNTGEHSDIVQSIWADITDRRGQIESDNPLAGLIRDETGHQQLSEDIISTWLQNNTLGSFAIKQSYAIVTSIGATPAEIAEYRRGGGRIPGGLQAAMEIPGSFIIDDGSAILPPNISPGNNAPLSESDLSTFLGLQGETISALRDMPQGSIEVINQAFVGNDANAIRRNLERAADSIDFQNVPDDPEARTLAFKSSSVMKMLSELSDTELVIFKDSLWTLTHR